MPLIPNIFEPGQVAASSDVNENFQAVEDTVGSDSSPTRLKPPGDIVLGPRANAQISAEADTAPNSGTRYIQIGWNVDLYNSGGWKTRRFNNGEPGVAIRVGASGFEVWSTSRTSGNLNNQLERLFQVRSDADNDYVFVRPSLTRVASPPDEIEDYRLTLVLFNDPKVVYENTTIYAGTKTRQSTDFGVPARAHAVLLSFEGKAASDDATITFMQARTGRSQRHGFVVAAGGNDPGGGQGIVALGISGDFNGKFVENRSAQWNSASLYIQGYFI